MNTNGKSFKKPNAERLVEQIRSRGLKNRVPLSNAVDTKLYDALNRLSEETRIPKSKLLDEAIELLLKEHGK